MKKKLKVIIQAMKFFRHIRKDKSVFFHDHKEIADNAFDRVEFIIELCKNKRVLHLGFLDSPFCEENVKNNSLLHTKIMEVSSYLFGIDIDDKSLNLYRTCTNDKENMIFDIGVPASEDEIKMLANNYDIVLLGEVLEHLKNPGIALQNLYNICKLNGAKLCVTVPNAFFLLGFCAALRGNEIVHPNHYYYFSPSTLNVLLKDSGFNDININFYISGDMVDMPGIIKNGLIATCQP